MSLAVNKVIFPNPLQLQFRGPDNGSALSSSFKSHQTCLVPGGLAPIRSSARGCSSGMRYEREDISPSTCPGWVLPIYTICLALSSLGERPKGFGVALTIIANCSSTRQALVREESRRTRDEQVQAITRRAGQRMHLIKINKGSRVEPPIFA